MHIRRLALCVSLLASIACDVDDVSAEQKTPGDSLLIFHIEVAIDDPEFGGTIIAQIDTIDLHGRGGWETLELGEVVSIEPGQPALVAHGMVDRANIKSIRLHGTFSLAQGDKLAPLSLHPARDLQIKIDQPLAVGMVNHVHVDLAEGLDLDRQTLHPNVDASVTTTGDFASVEVTPSMGGTLSLDDGFELLIPPNATTEAFVAHVERLPQEDGGWHYQLGPAGMTFDEPVVVKIPSSSDEAIVSWDFEQIAGGFDEQHRIVAANTHFSCVTDAVRLRNPINVAGHDAAFLYTGRACNTNYALMVIDLFNPQITVDTLVGDKSPNQAGAGGPEGCENQTIFETGLVNSLMKKDGHEPLVGMAADPHLPWDGIEATAATSNKNGCVRDAFVIDGMVLRGLNPMPEPVKYIIDFANVPGGVLAKVRGPETTNLVNPTSVLTAHFPYLIDGKKGYASTDSKSILFTYGSRSSLGFTSDRRFMIMAVSDGWELLDEMAQTESEEGNDPNVLQFPPPNPLLFGSTYPVDKIEDGFLALQWVELLKQPITLPEGLYADDVIYIDDAYRLDEGPRVDLPYYPDGEDAEHPKASVAGSMRYIGGQTINALGVFWNPTVPCTYQMSQHQCYGWTETDVDPNPDTPNLPKDREVMEICGLVDSSGGVTIKARKFDDGEFGTRPYVVRVSDNDDIPCHEGDEFVESSHDWMLNPDKTRLQFEFSSLWSPNQSDKDYCVTAPTIPSDPWYDASDPLQKTWWWSDKATLTRTCTQPAP